jgi:D-hydroxyproline dehydrogenase subunit gamma
MTEPRVQIMVNGAPVEVDAGVTVASALLNAGVTAFRASVTGERRAPLCGMGICYECRARIDGSDHQRTCLRVVSPGMHVETPR